LNFLVPKNKWGFWRYFNYGKTPAHAIAFNPVAIRALEIPSRVTVEGEGFFVLPRER
jgi:hypothetical protein